MPNARYFGLIAAAGAGSRFGGETPKQYVDVAGKPLLQHAVERLVEDTPLARVFVVLAPDDRRFRALGLEGGRVTALYCGGDSRAASVRNGLELMRGEAHERDWVLVHDAARPCLDRQALVRLLVEAGEDETGGLLAVPVADTLKREDPGARGATTVAGEGRRVAETVARDGLWQAQTPQMFRYGLLVAALRQPRAERFTDEAQAVEAMGRMPRLVAGSRTNLKVTLAEDLWLARAILAAQAAVS
jgi:2-C-methyl-D-erythritol 4-phosphate cytidylyltransferase